jgi:hypothetical protein
MKLSFSARFDVVLAQTPGRERTPLMHLSLFSFIGAYMEN